VVDATDFSSRTSSSALSGIVPLPTTAGREAEVVDVAEDPGTVEDVELSTTEVAEEGNSSRNLRRDAIFALALVSVFFVLFLFNSILYFVTDDRQRDGRQWRWRRR